MRKLFRRWFGVILFAGVSASFFLFQNCSSPMQGDLFDKEDLSSLGAKAPFAYDATLDQIAYMSCSELTGGFDRRAFFSIKAGAYTTGGLRLTDKFRNAMKDLHPKTDPLELILASPLNSNLVPQLDLRLRTGLSSKFSLTVPVGDDFSLLTGPMTQDSVARPLFNAGLGQRVRLFTPSTASPPRVFEGRVNFINGVDAFANNIRNALSSTHYLTLTFAEFIDASGNMPAQSPIEDPSIPSADKRAYNASQTVFGRGYGLHFTTASPPDFGEGGSPHTDLGTRVLASISETNLDLISRAGDAGGSWNRPNTLRFKIVRPEDTAACSPPAVDTDSDLMRRVRYVLPVDQWKVDLNRKCVVQKVSGAGSCYGTDFPDNNNKKVSYDLSLPCGPTNTANGKCAHFVSICYR